MSNIGCKLNAGPIYRIDISRWYCTMQNKIHQQDLHGVIPHQKQAKMLCSICPEVFSFQDALERQMG